MGETQYGHYCCYYLADGNSLGRQWSCLLGVILSVQRKRSCLIPAMTRQWWELYTISLCLLNVSNYFHCLITSMTRKPRPIFISPTETWRIEECSVGTERIYKICFLEIKGSGGMKEFHGVKLRCCVVWCGAGDPPQCLMFVSHNGNLLITVRNTIKWMKNIG